MQLHRTDEVETASPSSPTSGLWRRRWLQNLQVQVEQRQPVRITLPDWDDPRVPPPDAESGGAAPSPVNLEEGNHQGAATAPTQFPMGLRNAAATFSSLASANTSASHDAAMPARAGLPPTHQGHAGRRPRHARLEQPWAPRSTAQRSSGVTHQPAPPQGGHLPTTGVIRVRHEEEGPRILCARAGAITAPVIHLHRTTRHATTPHHLTNGTLPAPVVRSGTTAGSMTLRHSGGT
jgi:hypothetical protein